MTAKRSTTGDDDHYPTMHRRGVNWATWYCGGCLKWWDVGGTSKRAVNAHVRFSKGRAKR